MTEASGSAPTRRAVLDLLKRNGPQTVAQLGAALALAGVGVPRHLAVTDHMRRAPAPGAGAGPPPPGGAGPHPAGPAALPPEGPRPAGLCLRPDRDGPRPVT